MFDYSRKPVKWQVGNFSYLRNVSETAKMKVVYPNSSKPLEFNEEVTKSAPKSSSAKAMFFNRAFCSGLFSSLYILPDGKVTICEQLYWHKPFIVGDIKKQSLMEVWNSKQAKSLYYLKQSSIPKDSLCHSCADFKECRNKRQVCYRDIVKKYGFDKWYYPDVKCPFAKD